MKTGICSIVVFKQAASVCTVIFCITLGIEIVNFAVNSLQSRKSLTVFSISESVSVGIEAVSRLYALITSAVFIKVIPILVDLVFEQQLPTAFQTYSLLEEIILAVYLSPATSIVVEAGAVVISPTEQSLSPNSGCQLAIDKVICNNTDFNVTVSTDLCFSVKVIPIGTDHLPAGKSYAVLEVIIISLYLFQARYCRGIAALFTNKSTVNYNIVMTGGGNSSAPLNDGSASFKSITGIFSGIAANATHTNRTAGVTVLGTGSRLVGNSDRTMLMPALLGILLGLSYQVSMLIHFGINYILRAGESIGITVNERYNTLDHA